MGDAWGERFEEYGSQLIEALGYDYYRRKDLESKERLNNSDVDGLLYTNTRKPSLLLAPSFHNPYSKICIEFKTGANANRLRKKFKKDEVALPSRNTHTLYQIFRNAVDYAEDEDEIFLELVVIDKPVNKEDQDNLTLKLEEDVEPTKKFNKDDIETLRDQVDFYLIDAGRLSMYLNKQSVSMLFREGMKWTDGISGGDLEEIQLPKIEDNELDEYLYGEQELEYRQDETDDFVNNVTLLMAKSTAPGQVSHRDLTLDVFIDREDALEKDDFEAIFDYLVNFLTVYFLTTRYPNIEKDYQFSMDVGVHCLSANYESIDRLRADLQDIRDQYLRGPGSELREKFKEKEEVLVEEEVHEEENLITLQISSNMRIYDYESFGLGGLSLLSGHPFYFRET